MAVRILHVFDHSLPLHSGYTFRSAAILSAQRKLGWQTLHLTSLKQGRTESAVDVVGGLEFYRTPFPHGGLSHIAGLRELQLMNHLERRLTQLVEQWHPDIVHAHSPVLNAYPALRVGRRFGLPVVYEIRAFWEDAAVDHGTTTEGSFRYWFTRALETRAVKKAAHVFTICDGLRRDLVGRGVPRSHITVIPNAVDSSGFQPSGKPDPELARSLGIAGKLVLGFIGSFYAYEGIGLLLDALPRILEVRPEATVLLVGGGPEEERLKHHAQQLGLAGKVVFVGRVPHQEVHRYYDLVDVLTYPRHSMRLTELVTPLKPLEAMAQQKLYVASAVGGHRELVDNWRTGVLFKPDDPAALAAAVLDLLDKPDRWTEMRANGRAHVERVRTWDNSVAGYRSVYECLTGKRSTP